MGTDLLYLALGDSTGVGVGASAGGGYPERLLVRLQAARPAFRLLNLCQSGATTQDLIAGQLPDALRLRPSLVTVGIGINDVGMMLPEESFAANLQTLLLSLRRLGAKVALLNIPDLALAPAMAAMRGSSYERRIELFNEQIELSAARHEVLLVDLFSLSREKLRDRPGLFSPDGFHPSAEGYEAWAGLMFPHVDSLLGDRRGEARNI